MTGPKKRHASAEPLVEYYPSVRPSCGGCACRYRSIDSASYFIRSLGRESATDKTSKRTPPPSVHNARNNIMTTRWRVTISCRMTILFYYYNAISRLVMGFRVVSCNRTRRVSRTLFFHYLSAVAVCRARHRARCN